MYTTAGLLGTRGVRALGPFALFTEKLLLSAESSLFALSHLLVKDLLKSDLTPRERVGKLPDEGHFLDDGTQYRNGIIIFRDFG